MKIKDSTPESISHKILQDFYVAEAFGDLSIKDRKSAKSLSVEIEASHSGIINGNKYLYLPKGMANGASTFITPFPKPVLVNHDEKSNPIGRVHDSSYIKYDIMDPFGISNSSHPTDIIEGIMDFVRSPVFTQQDYKGLGHLNLKASITDEDAIKRILDKRYLTVSIGGTCKDVTCSRCGMDIKKQRQDMMRDIESGRDPDTSVCDHMAGYKYSDHEPSLFWIGGDMEFDELSYVSSPADPNAISRVANSKKLGNSITICDIKFGKPKDDSVISVYITNKDHKPESEMKKLKDFLAKPEETLAAVKDTLKTLGLEKFIVTDDKYAAMRKPSFLFADLKVLPIHDKAHVLAAYKILEGIEDEGGSTLTEAMSILDAKAVRLFGEDYKIEDVTKALFDEANPAAITQTTKTADELAAEEAARLQATNPTIEIDYVKLADEISAKISDLITKENKSSYEFLTKRVSILEKELEDMINNENKVTDQIKNYIIDHILTIAKDEKSEELLTRSIESLSDKLKDLKEKSTTAATTTVTTTVIDTKVIIDPTTVTVKDNNGNVVDPNAKVNEPTTKVDTSQFLDKKIVSAEYRKILKSGGLKDARNYLDDLKKNNKVHKDFKLM